MEQKGFVASLFDLSFTEFVTMRVIKALYVLLIILSAIVSVMVLINCIVAGPTMAVLGIICLAPLTFFLYVLMARIWVEVIIVLFRIAENMGLLGEQCEKDAPSDAE